MELISFGMEEISSEQAAPLLAQIHECSECAGQWVLIHKTIDTLSHVGETDISNQKSQQMWLVCMEHAKHKHPSEMDLSQEHLISSHEVSRSGHESSHDGANGDEQEAHDDASKGIEHLTKQLGKMRTPLALLGPSLGFAMAGSAMLMWFSA